MSEHLRPEDAAGLVMLAEDDAERVAAQAHAAGCADCAAELTSARTALTPLSALDEVAPSSPAVLERIRREIVGAGAPKKADARSQSWAAAGGAIAVAGLAAVLFRGFSVDVLAWVEGGLALVLGLAAILSVRDEASGRTALLVSSAGAMAVAMLSMEPGATEEWTHAGFCAGTQVVGALAPALVALFVAGPKPTAMTVAGRGAGGALVALSTLSLVCPVHSARHVLLFHVVSVAVAALVASAVVRTVASRRA